MLTAIIADDEPLLLCEMESLLADLWPELTIVGRAKDGVTALRLIDELQPDISFLDIRMPKMSGLEVAERTQGTCDVVFVTAFDVHALEAFEKGAVDYLLKPVTHLRLSATVSRIRERLQTRRQTTAQLRDKDTLECIQASAGNTLRFFHLTEILYFRSDSKYTRIVTSDAEGYVRKSMVEFMRVLDKRQFWQINRGILVNVRHIKAVMRHDDGEMSLQLRNHVDVLPISRVHQSQFRGY